jgi:ribosomal-protein-alanine acetyltransferase
MVRLPQPGDVRFLERAEQICFSDPWPGHLLAAELMAPSRFHRLLVDPAGRIIGYLFAAWQYLDLHVLKVAILPGFRRQGHARQLMALAEDHAIEMCGETLTLEVRQSNIEAVALYDSLGYRLRGRRRGYYMDGEDALVMTKAVAP